MQICIPYGILLGSSYGRMPTWSRRQGYSTRGLRILALRCFNRTLKKILAILLLTVFGLPFATPLLAASRSGEEGVPVCCRRAGKHHCAWEMGESARSDSGPRFRRLAERCPFAPQASVPSHHEVAVPSVAASIFTSVVSHPCGSTQTESMWRIARDRSRLKRGPPAVVLS